MSSIAAHLARGKGVIRVVADLRGQVERDAQTRDAVIEQIAKALVRFGGGGEARVLPHRPGAAAVHVRLNAARVREGARGADVALEIGGDEVFRRREGPCLGARGHSTSRIVARGSRQAGHLFLAKNVPKKRRFVDTLLRCLYNADSLLWKAKPLYLKPLAPDPCRPPRLGRFGLGNAPDSRPGGG
jgi:hypothetical protein